jgi:antitoxin component YwqK of YwqJK toxin-antitoxin module
MKSSLIILFSVLALSSKAQITKIFNSECQCTIVTNRYADGQISNEHHLNEEGEKNGIETAFYPDGSKQLERVWKNGKLDGKGIHFHSDGTVYYEEFHNNGAKTGEWLFRDLEGDLIETIAYSIGEGNETHRYYHAGINYFTQELVDGRMVSEVINDPIIYAQLKSEASANKAKKE